MESSPTAPKHNNQERSLLLLFNAGERITRLLVPPLWLKFSFAPCSLLQQAACNKPALQSYAVCPQLLTAVSSSLTLICPFVLFCFALLLLLLRNHLFFVFLLFLILFFVRFEPRQVLRWPLHSYLNMSCGFLCQSSVVCCLLSAKAIKIASRDARKDVVGPPTP